MTLRIHLAAPPFRRNPPDEGQDCPIYEVGAAVSGSDCQTDGHYLCAGCVHNIHRLEDHSPCHHSPCYGPGKPWEDPRWAR